MPEKSVKRLEALKERQLVNERRIRKDMEDSKKELKQLENDSSKSSAVAEKEMVKLTENLQRSLQNRSMLEAKMAEMRPAQQSHALRRRAAEEKAWNLLRETQLVEEEFCDLQKALKVKCEEKEKRLHQLQQQREEVRRLSQEASQDAREAATLEAEATQLKAKATQEVQRELALDRAILACRTSLQCRIFRALADYVCEHKREEEEERRRLQSWFCSNGPQFLRAWHVRAAQLLALRCALDVTDAAQLAVAFRAWGEVLEEERLWSHFARRVTPWRRRHLRRVGLALWRAGVKQSKRQDSWPHHRILLSNVLRKWHEVSLVALHLRERLTWAEMHLLAMQLPFQRAVFRRWQLQCQETGTRAKRLKGRCSFRERKKKLRSWRTLWLFHSGFRGPLRRLARHCLKTAFWAFQMNLLLAYFALVDGRRRLRRSFDALQRHLQRRQGGQDKPVQTLRPLRRVMVVWGWWRFLAKQSQQLKACREKWKRFLLQKRLQHWHRFVEIRKRTKRDAWRKFRNICSSRRRRRLLLEGFQLGRRKDLLHQTFMAFLMCWERAARQKRQSMHGAQEECQALAQRLQLAERQTQELQEMRLSEEAAMEDLMTEKRLLEFFQQHMHHEFECHQKTQQKFEALVASQSFELEEELRLTCSSQMTLEGLLRNEELRVEAMKESEERDIKAPFRSRLREMQAAAEARLKEKEEEVCSLRQSVLRSSQSQLRVKFANS